MTTAHRYCPWHILEYCCIILLLLYCSMHITIILLYKYDIIVLLYSLQNLLQVWVVNTCININSSSTGTWLQHVHRRCRKHASAPGSRYAQRCADSRQRMDIILVLHSQPQAPFITMHVKEENVCRAPCN